MRYSKALRVASLLAKAPTDLQDILDGAALQRATAFNFEIAPSISVSGFAVAFGSAQRDRLRSTQKRVLGVAMVL
jgi:hypothetical protein